jgi:hypothetical protein
MPRNMGVLDRGLRTFVVAPVAIVLAFVIGVGTVGGIILFVVAGIMLGSSATGFCPTYILLGISTEPNGSHHVGHHLSSLRGGHA